MGRLSPAVALVPLVALLAGGASLAVGTWADAMCRQVASRMSVGIDSCDAMVTTVTLPSESDHVPLSWDLVLTGSEQVLAQETRSRMLDTDATWSEWPRHLVAEASGDMGRAMHALYSDHPEMSVFTDGEYRPWGDAGALCPSDDERSRRLSEMREVSRQADEVAEEIDAEIRGLRERRSWMRDSDDHLYAMRVFQYLGRTTTYSDGIDDSEHENDVYGALVEGESRCYGLACAAKALLDRKGIPSFVATGSSDAGRHAVAIAWVDGRWRVIDVTEIQGREVPEPIDAACAGYWGNIACPYGCYVSQTGFEPDGECLDLMRAYEGIVGATGETDGA